MKIRINSNWVLTILVVAYIAIFTYVSFARVDTHKSYLADIGIYDQVVWSTAQGNFSNQVYSFNSTGTRSFFHFNPFILLFVPLYLLVSSARWLLLAQTVALGVSVIPVFWLGRKYLNEKVALILSACYLLYFPLQNGNLYDFHEIGMAVPFIAFMIWAVIENRLKVFWILALIILTIQEDMALFVFSMGFYLFVTRRYWNGLIAMVFSTVYFLLVMKCIIPVVPGAGTAVNYKATAGYLPRFAWLGSSIFEIVKTVLTRPVYVISHVATPQVIAYLGGMFLPLMLLPLGSLVLVICLPTMLVNILSQNQMMHNYYFYHSMVLPPALFIATIFALVKIRSYRESLFNLLVFAIVVSSVIFNLCCGLLPYSFNALKYSFEDLKDRPIYHEVDQIAKLIPASASVCTQENLGIFFSQRPYIYEFPADASSADYVVLSFNNTFYGVRRDFLFRSYMQRPESERRAIVADLIKEHNYKPVYDHNGYLVLKK